MAGIAIPGSVSSFSGAGASARRQRQNLLDAASRAVSNAKSWTSASATSKAGVAVALANQTGGNILGFTYE